MTSKGYQAWLQNGFEPDHAAMGPIHDFLQQIITTAQAGSGIYQTAVQELVDGIRSITGQKPVCMESGSGRYLTLGTIGSSSFIDQSIEAGEAERLGDEGFVIRKVDRGEHVYIVLAGKTEKGLLYAVFHFLRLLKTGGLTDQVDVTEVPKYRLRMVNHWDNMDGSVERGYAGQSIFYRNDVLLSRSARVRDYARLLASVGINGIAINNVNVHRHETRLITEVYLPDVARIADIFRNYGIRLYLSVNFAAPIELGDLRTADPLDADVQKWWKEKAADVYCYVPDFGGFLVKADSENRPGPFTYGRDHADGANMLAEALKPYGGIVLWRCFVYNCHQDWRDRTTDRARAAYDHFKPLDGRFLDNVVLQIKNGPMDFQVREPVSPLIGAMEKTNQIVEFQITQEYTGQQKDVCYLIPQWKEVLDFDTRIKGEGSTVKEIAAGLVHPYVHSGITAVSNIGDDLNWTGHHLAQANLYGYGRLIWNPELSSELIAKEWALLTFGPNKAAADTIADILMASWPIYEKYTSPLGVGWMVRPHYHYGPDIDGYEYSKWGTYHFADCHGIGVDRTQSTGTGYSAQYEKANSELYENLETCPDELLLFFHHVPYTHRLKSGKTVIQHIYDTHFEGVEQVEQVISRWRGLEGDIDAERYRHVCGRLEAQLENAKEWRDVINTYFYRKSAIPDEKNRVIY
ncbi:alpha-glucuronidase family glycosyl hydrolase [Paenibacillus abyssi]|uniref:Xylan alpha-1,2-glucuronidase n=1 Tax=Paenibacillus abyssi TaxID=1340531 RepID=A0A917CRT3_9BACL|nr:alpha-glucuronidase family glycosyl hydrolase [Paenibacillus abyssi]GGF94912.1 xylan alpha-1,2-glucuronidase [Paenibacillus abyssi]